MRRIGAVLALCGALIGQGALADSDSCAPERLDIRGDWGQAQFSVELAQTVQERARGLMFRESLGASQGMLFLYPRPDRHAFWMKNTLIPLDMIFITPEGVVQYVHENAIPQDLTPISGGDGVIAVLEIKGGMARILGIEEGSELRHPGFDPEIAAWPCAPAN
ncbi:DUF192 domain-containing protein [Aliiroseovarius sp.]|uniref:DUF192 domain-containing protein n=1 Tax=Aliiroseovarius sp. TaxID=1872442 RepID=UPI00261C2560|nr:DUF192 domain-containing protein [Aliiroseovarius sp.]